MSCIVKPGSVLKYTSDAMEIYYYILNDVANQKGQVGGVCISSVGDLLRACGHFVVDVVLDDSYETITRAPMKDYYPKEGDLYLYKTEGMWKVLKFTKYSVGYCFDSLTDGCKYNLPGGVFVYPLVGITESMLTTDAEAIESKYDYDKLAKEYHSLVEEYSELKEQKDDLEKKVDYYFDQCKFLKEEVDSLKKENEKLKTMNELKTEAIENYIHPEDTCKYWDGESCTVEAVDVKPYKEEIEKLKNLIVNLTEELMERR